MACSSCINWCPINRDRDEKARCNAVIDHDYVDTADPFVKFHRDFACSLFHSLEDYRDHVLEKGQEDSLMRWFSKDEERL